jgi:hypothetical protein
MVRDIAITENNLPMHTAFHRMIRQMLTVFSIFFVASGQIRAQKAPVREVTIQLDSKTVTGRIAPDFIGFGYETSAVAQTNYFRGDNCTLIRLYRQLGANGLIRIGGNISDHTRYEPTGTSTVNPEEAVTIINQRNLEDLAAFARATGWKVMWGLNLGTGSREEAAQEAVAVTKILGDRLQSFEIGNEVDLRGRYELKYNDFNSYYSNFLAYKASIRAALPSAEFSGPDVAGNFSWLRTFAQKEGKDVRLLTHHYYRTGASSPSATLENLLGTDEGWIKRLQQLRTISSESGVPFRINEINSFSGGGKVGVSDTFASALWCLDYMFQSATFGCDGVNMETDINQHAWVSHYSPIAHREDWSCEAHPEYYGMLAFALAGKGDLLHAILEKDGAIHLTAYATRDDGKIWLIVVNKDLACDANISLALPEGSAKSEAFRLEAPSVDSTNQVTLAGTKVSSDGAWTPGSPEKVSVEGHFVHFSVPHASALLLRLGN